MCARIKKNSDSRVLTRGLNASFHAALVVAVAGDLYFWNLCSHPNEVEVNEISFVAFKTLKINRINEQIRISFRAAMR